MRSRLAVAIATTLIVSVGGSALAAACGDPDQCAIETEARMSDDERFQMLIGIMPIPLPGKPKVDIPADSKKSAGYVNGIPRLNIPSIRETDASLGVANLIEIRKGDAATALPSGLALGASFNPDLLYRSGEMIGGEARAKNFNVLLAGGVNLARDPRNGRNFEYLGEDPLLAGTLAGESIRGIQSRGVISTVKHFSLNDQETLRASLDARIDEAAHRESDLLAFEIAIERGQPGSVMCAYNQVNGAYSCGSDALLNGVLKRDWGYKGWVMSDWGAVHDVSYFSAGLDQQSGSQLDKEFFFNSPLKAEVAAGRVSKERVSDAVRRILRSIYAVGADWEPSESTIDYEANAKLALEAAIQGIVVLKNDGVLPLSVDGKSILVVGGYAEAGVMSGGGSSQVRPVGGAAATIPSGGAGFLKVAGWQLIVPSSPLKALTAALPRSTIAFDSGYTPELSAILASKADLVIVFATQWQSESQDSGSLTLSGGQNELISQLAKANPNTIVVLETGNPVTMPWLDQVRAVVEAWYPGQEGGRAIAEVLSGNANPSGRLPISFPRDEGQNPRPKVPGYGEPDDTPITVEYHEGAEVGYRWFAAKSMKPLFPFGHGLSYTRFEHGAPILSVLGNAIKARFHVRNAGERRGADVPQLYLIAANGKPLKRLVGFQRVELRPGESRDLTLSIEPRTLAHWKNDKWQIDSGVYRFALGKSADDLGSPADVRLQEQRW